jgi:hypothetical protein
MRKLSLLGILLLLAAVGFAGSPNITYNRTIDYSPHDVIGNCRGACTRANGGVMFVDGYDDWIIQVATPLTSDGSTNDALNSWGVYQASPDGGTTYDFNSGMSYQAISYDGTHYYASGYNGTGTCNLYQLTDGTPWIGSKMTVSPDGGYSGVTTVGSNVLVMPDYNTGAIQFFTVSGTTATAYGSPIANTSNGTYKTTQAYYYNDGSGRWIFTYMVDTNLTRRIDVFQTDGTPGGTTYMGTLCPAIATNFSVEGTNVLKYCNLTCSAFKKVLVAAAAVDTAGPNGYDLFDISTVTYAGTATPYNQLRSADFTNTSGSNRLTAGAAFFASNAEIALIAANKLFVYDVEVLTSTEDWSLY